MNGLIIASSISAACGFGLIILSVFRENDVGALLGMMILLLSIIFGAAGIAYVIDGCAV